MAIKRVQTPFAASERSIRRLERAEEEARKQIQRQESRAFDERMRQRRAERQRSEQIRRKAGLAEERKVGDDKMIFIENCKNPMSVAILIRAGLERMVDEAERALNDALSVISDVIEHNKVVTGGGATESEIAKHLRDYAPTVGGREQLAIEAFAEAIEIVPKTIAENAGLEPIDILVGLRAAHEKPKGRRK